MSASGLVAWSLVAAAGCLLGFAGAGHLRHPAWLRAVLAAQGLLPPALRPPVVRLLGPAELVLGLTGLLALGLGVEPPLRACCLLTGLLHLLFAGHSALLLRLRPEAPCGCLGGAEPVSGAVVARATVLAAAGFGCLLLPPPPAPAWRLLALVAGGLLAVPLGLAPRLLRR